MLKNRFILSTTIIGLVLVQIMLWLLFLKRTQLPPQVPFNYLAPWGEARLAPSFHLWYLPLIGGVSLAADLLLAAYFFRREKVVAKLLTLSALFLNLILTLSLLRIFSLL